MELVLLVGLLITLGVLALRFGYDSREQLSSFEEQQARAGMRW